MAARSAISQVVQIGLEGAGTPGTAVPANKRLTALGFRPTPATDFRRFRPMGLKYPTIEALLREWTSSPVEGYPTYTEIVYPLSSILETVTASTTTGVTTWAFLPKSDVADDPATFTIEIGDATIAERVTYGILTEFGFNFNRAGDSGISGNMMGRALETGITLTASPTSIALQPIVPAHVSCYLDATSGALGTTKLTHMIQSNWVLGNRFGPLWVLDRAISGWKEHVEIEPDNRFEIQALADTVGNAYLTQMRDGTTKFFRMECIGPNIPASTPTTPFSLVIDAAVQVGGGGDREDAQGVYAVNHRLSIVHDATWGKAFVVTVKNNITAL